MTSFAFTNLDIALGQGKTAEQNATLLIIAQGTQTKLKQESFIDDSTHTEKVVMPDRDATSGRIISSTGYYAISFGVGEQNVGEGRISFHEDDFVTGARLLPVISFKNTGDVPIRGGETANPIKLQLHITGKPDVINPPAGTAVHYDGSGEMLAEWEIYGNIPVGGIISTVSSGTDMYTKPLPDELNGRRLYFTVSEDCSYVVSENCFQYSSLTDEKGFTVLIEDKPELGIEEMTFKTVGVDDQGNIIIETDLLAANRGVADANGVYLQFSRQSGVDADGFEVYSPVDLRGHKLEISEQKP